jgi:hypothetical protein
MTRSVDDVKLVASLAQEGLGASAISRRTGIPRCTVRDWLAVDLDELVLRRAPLQPCNSDCDWPSRVPPEAYAYLLGLYLGDGCISRAGRSRRCFNLRVVLDDAYPGIIASCESAMLAVLARTVWRIQKEGCTEVTSCSNHWPCVFPQHGPGRKHERLIRLEEWQSDIALRGYPRAFLRGLIHSDGSRDLNPVNGKDYPRYQFSNRSADIRDIFKAACQAVGVRATRGNKWSLQVATRSSVAILDSFIGPKADWCPGRDSNPHALTDNGF